MQTGIVILNQKGYFYLPTIEKWVYEFYEKRINDLGIEFLGGRFGVSYEEYDRMAERAERIVSRRNMDKAELTGEDLEYILGNSIVD